MHSENSSDIFARKLSKRSETFNMGWLCSFCLLSLLLILLLLLLNKSFFWCNLLTKRLWCYQVLRKEWVDPVVRPTLQTESQANLPAKKLQQRQREIAMEQKRAELKKGRKKTPPKFYSALEVFPHLKRKAQQGWVQEKESFVSSSRQDI